MAEMKTSELLVRSLKVLRERGWGQHSYVNADGSVCALGAGVIAQGRVVFNGPLLDKCDERYLFRIRDALVPFVPDGQVVSCFNDDPSTSYEDIELMFKHAIAAHQELEELALT